MLRRLSAFWLIAIITLPCTAPFSTCDFADFVASVHYSASATSSRAPAAPLAPAKPVAGIDCSYAPPLTTSLGRLRVLLVPVPAAVSAAVVQPARSALGRAYPPIPVPQPDPSRPRVLRV